MAAFARGPVKLWCAMFKLVVKPLCTSREKSVGEGSVSTNSGSGVTGVFGLPAVADTRRPRFSNNSVHE